ncbi:hypothetical protein GF377_04065 [candidate division GN15 bacterium]|nr:hypothetical protein [candidate division GN15 bacterium]
MWFGLKVTRPRGAAILLAFCLVLALSTSSEAIERVRVTVGDTTGDAGTDNSAISVFLQNTQDTVSAFELWLKLSRPDVVEFQTDLDTVVDTTYWYCKDSSGGVCVDSVSCNPDSVPYWICIDASGDLCNDSVFVTDCTFSHIDSVEALVGTIDTTGSRIAGWEFLATRSLTSTPYDIKITGQANETGGPIVPGVGPGSGLLFRLRGDILAISDTVSDRTVNILPQPFLDHLNFSRPDGTSIGIGEMEVLDTNYYRCNAWVPPDSVVCLDWEKVPGDEDHDSVEVVLDTVPFLDTTEVKLFNGSLTVNLYPGACCVDDSCFIASGVDGCEILAGGSYKGNGSECDSTTCLTCCQGSMRGNLDGDPGDAVTLGDLTVMIDHLFISLEPLECWDEGNLDGSTPEGEGSVSLGDLTVLIDHLFVSLDPLPPCP